MKTGSLCCAMVLAVGFTSVALGQTQPGGEKQRPKPAQIRMAVQKICPVTGQELGSHGQPVVVKIGKQQVYLCCKGCATGKVNKEHWATIHANFAKAQGICPVMKNKLPKNAKWTIVDGQIVYVCCPPCIKKIEAAPADYLKKVDRLYLASLQRSRPQQTSTR